MSDLRALEPIRCHGCGAPIALVDAATVTCAGCGAVTDVPELHRTALRAAHVDAEVRRSTAGVSVLGTMPSWPLRVLGTVFAGWKRLVAGAFFVFAAIGFLTVLAVLAIGAMRHVNVFVTVPTEMRDRYGVPLWFAFVLLSVGIGVYGQRRAVSLRGVQAALAARPPHTPGGPATCRQCGGPLAIPADAVDVRCIYCATDNLVALPPSWVTGFASSSRAASRELAQAERELAVQTTILRRRAITALACYAVGLIAVFALAAHANQQRHPDEVGDPKWWEHAGTPRDLVRRHPTRDLHDWHFGTHTIAFAADCIATPTSITLVPDECNTAGCTLWLYAALRDGENARLQLSGIPNDGRLEIAAPRWFAGWSLTPSDSFGARSGTVVLHPAEPASFTAGWTTWHELAVHLPGATPGPISACFSVDVK